MCVLVLLMLLCIPSKLAISNWVVGLNVLLVMVDDVKCITWHTFDLPYLWCLHAVAVGLPVQ